MEMNSNIQGMPGVTPEKKSYGPLIAVIIILLVMILGGLYFLGQRMGTDPYENLQTMQEGDEITNSLEAQSNSDETASIEADLKATNVDSLDQGAAAIEAEL